MAHLTFAVGASASAEVSPQERLVDAAILISQTRHCSKVKEARACAVHSRWKDEIRRCLADDGMSLTMDVCAYQRAPASLSAAGSETCGSVSCGAQLADDDDHLPRTQRAISPVLQDQHQLLLERWTLELSERRCDAGERVVGLPRLSQALKSTLLFSQLQSWLTLTQGRWSAHIRYNLSSPSGGRASQAKFPAASNAKKGHAVNTFPVASVSMAMVLTVRCVSLPYGSDIPFVGAELAQLVAERKLAACSPAPGASADAPRDNLTAKVKSAKRRSRPSKESEKKELLAESSSLDAPASPCVFCGSVPRLRKEAGERKRRTQCKGVAEAAAALPLCSLSPPAVPLRVKSPPRPICGAAVAATTSCHGTVTSPPPCPGSPLPCTPSFSSSEDSLFVSDHLIRQNSAPARTHGELSTSLASQRTDGRSSASTTPGLCSSSLLRNSSLKRITYRRPSQSDVAVGSPHPSMLVNQRGSGSYQRRTSCPGPLSSSPLLGSFEETMLWGRLAPTDLVEGYELRLRSSCAECSVSSPSITLSLRTEFYDSETGALSPYLGMAPAPNPPHQVSRHGTFQAVLYRPNGTVLRVFVVPYDLSCLGVGKMTFIRQRTLSSSLSVASKPSLLYAFHLSLQRGENGSLQLHKDVRVVFSPLPPDVYDVTPTPRELVTETLGPHMRTLSEVQLPRQEELPPATRSWSQKMAPTQRDVLASAAGLDSSACCSSVSSACCGSVAPGQDLPLPSGDSIQCKKMRAAATGVGGACVTPTSPVLKVAPMP